MKTQASITKIKGLVKRGNATRERADDARRSACRSMDNARDRV
jgi:hypothetical protein